MTGEKAEIGGENERNPNRIIRCHRADQVRKKKRKKKVVKERSDVSRKKKKEQFPARCPIVAEQEKKYKLDGQSEPKKTDEMAMRSSEGNGNCKGLGPVRPMSLKRLDTKP